MNKIAVDLTRREEENCRPRKDKRVGTLDANYYKGLANQERPGVLDNMKIRRLTPKECERLQGFPDDWTKIGFEGYGQFNDQYFSKISDTQRYKMCGNAVTVNVIKEIMLRLC
jgi:DNA (cytosine-5)-methyltransferase 1